jgi:uncharacterized protein YodC (DUF2158 family)
VEQLNTDSYMPVGTVVELQSGGPDMTVIGFTSTASVEVLCVWFNQSDELQEGEFPAGALRKSGRSKPTEMP